MIRERLSGFSLSSDVKTPKVLLRRFIFLFYFKNLLIILSFQGLNG